MRKTPFDKKGGKWYSGAEIGDSLWRTNDAGRKSNSIIPKYSDRASSRLESARNTFDDATKAQLAGAMNIPDTVGLGGISAQRAAQSTNEFYGGSGSQGLSQMLRYGSGLADQVGRDAGNEFGAMANMRSNAAQSVGRNVATGESAEMAHRKALAQRDLNIQNYTLGAAAMRRQAADIQEDFFMNSILLEGERERIANELQRAKDEADANSFWNTLKGGLTATGVIGGGIIGSIVPGAGTAAGAAAGGAIGGATGSILEGALR